MLPVRHVAAGRPAYRQKLVEELATLPVDAIWLRVHPFGTRASGPLSLRQYIESCRDLHRLGLPLVAERTGTVGLALMAFGAVGGMESGVTIGENWDVTRFLNGSTAKSGKGYLPAARVYLPAIGAFVTVKEAGELFDHPGMRSSLGCQESSCCRQVRSRIPVLSCRRLLTRTDPLRPSPWRRVLPWSSCGCPSWSRRRRSGLLRGRARR